MQHDTITEQQTETVPVGYALKMFLGWSILSMGSMVAVIELLHRSI